MLYLWGMQNTPSIPSLPGPLLSRVVAPDRVWYMAQIELNCVLWLTELFEVELFICRKMDLALHYLQWLMCHKTQLNQTGLMLWKIDTEVTAHMSISPSVFCEHFYSYVTVDGNLIDKYLVFLKFFITYPVSWVYWMHQLHLCRG